MWNVALSTLWGMGSFRHLKGFFSAARRLGFQQFELGRDVSPQMVDGLDLRGYRITSIHEPCPAYVPAATLEDRDWLVSSIDEYCRQRGVRAVQHSIDLAQEIGASAVVVHLGRVDVDPQLERELRGMFEAGQAHTPGYNKAKERLVEARAARASANLGGARRSLIELAEYASQAGVRLGVENRYHYSDIPLLDEMNGLLALDDHGQIGFWYDVGHAQTLEHLGFDLHEEWLGRYASAMLGVHLHDVKGIRDHLPAGLGEVDWAMVASYLPQDVIRTYEIRNHNTAEQVEASMCFLAAEGCVTRL